LTNNLDFETVPSPIIKREKAYDPLKDEPETEEEILAFGWNFLLIFIIHFPIWYFFL
jgi:hypothetical protein